MSMLNYVLSPAWSTVIAVGIIVRAMRTALLWKEIVSRENLSTARALFVRLVAEVFGVQPSMGTDRRQFQVLRAIIKFVAVPVVDVLTVLQRAAEYLFHHTTMLSLSVALRRDVAVAVMNVAGAPFTLPRGCRSVFTQPLVVLVAEGVCYNRLMAVRDAASRHTAPYFTWRMV